MDEPSRWKTGSTGFTCWWGWYSGGRTPSRRPCDPGCVIVGFMIPLNGKRCASPLKHLEHVLHPWSAFLILPLFALPTPGVSR